MEAIVREHLDLPDLPSFSDLETEAKLVFVNTHFSIEYASSLPPMYIPVGGLHLEGKGKKPTDLPKV
jgi:hypothetical protein